MTTYPAQIDNSISLPPAIDNITGVSASVSNGLRAAIIAIETQLGIAPAGTYGTIANRFSIIEEILNTSGSFFSPAGDLSGSGTFQTVIGLQNRPISSTSPSSGQVLEWSGSAWAPATINGVNPFGSIINVNSGQTVTASNPNAAFLCNTSTSGCTVNAMLSPSNAILYVKDATAAASFLNQITISGNGNNIEDPMSPVPGTFSSSVTIATPGWSGTWMWDPGNTRWTLI